MSIASVMPSNHLILYRPLLLLPSIFPSIRVFSNESVVHIRRPKYWSFSFSISWYIIKFLWISWSKTKTERHRCWFKTVISKILKRCTFSVKEQTSKYPKIFENRPQNILKSCTTVLKFHVMKHIQKLKLKELTKI